MKKIIFLFLASSLFLISACGLSAKEKKEKFTNDSITKADSIAKSIVAVESWDFYLTAKKDTNAFKNKYAHKKLILSNLVLENIWSSKKILQCLAYSPKDSIVSSPSRDAVKKLKLDKSQTIVQGITGKYYPEGPYYIELHFNTPVDIATLKECFVKEESKVKFWNYYTILTVEGDSAYIRSNSYVINNCVIKENNTK